jgi:hypothetical protein
MVYIYIYMVTTIRAVLTPLLSLPDLHWHQAMCINCGPNLRWSECMWILSSHVSSPFFFPSFTYMLPNLSWFPQHQYPGSFSSPILICESIVSYSKMKGPDGWQGASLILLKVVVFFTERKFYDNYFYIWLFRISHFHHILSV